MVTLILKALWHIWGKLAVPWFTNTIVDIKWCMELNVMIRSNVQQNKLLLVKEGDFNLMDVCKLKVMHAELHGSPLM